ncbi:MAG TPA: T9SS type A sorting domain-containing protein, partial [Mucilaginibacter sp.]|nr:T9SS type A sorting domain-containing protein [Mucilaginibacter sp.]
TLAPVNNTYYAGLNDFSGTIGPATKYVFAGGGYNQFTPYVNVSTRIPIIIKSARLYIGNSGKITFNVANANGEVVSSTTINAVATNANPGPGAQPDDPTDQGAVYPLNLLLPQPGAYTISTVYDSTATIYRSNAGVNGYPFTKGDVFSIDGNDAVSATDTAYYKGFYYYFYDMQLQSAGCASASKQAVTVTKPVISQNGSILSSSFSSGNQWYLDGTAVPGATGASFTATKSGNYTVGVTLSTGCQVLSDNLVVVVTTSTGSNSDIGLVVYPVPVSSKLNIIFAAANNSNLNLSLIDAAGIQVYSAGQTVAAGNVSTSIDISTLAPGSYVLKLLLGQKAYYDKIVVLR